MGRPPKTFPTRRTSSVRPSKIRRRCDNCGKLFPRTRTDKKFCDDNCRKEFHRHGAAYGPIKQALEKLIEKTVKSEVQKYATRLTALELANVERAEVEAQREAVRGQIKITDTTACV
jgi:hypothetical protein